MEEIVSAWNTARWVHHHATGLILGVWPIIHVPNRPFVLQLLNRHDHLVDQGTPKKRKRSPEWTPTVESMLFKSVAAGPSKSRTPSSPTKQPTTPLTRKLKASSDSDEDAAEIMVPSSDVDEDEISANPTRLNPQGNFLKLTDCGSFLYYLLIDDDLVHCPICNAKVQYKRLNGHMDNNCEDPPSAGSTLKTWSKIMARPKSTPNITQLKGKNKYVNKKKIFMVLFIRPELKLSCRKKTSDTDDELEDYPIPKASYGTLKDKQLKDILREYGLPVTGDRVAWEQRHQQCV